MASKSRGWLTLVYPESVKYDWIQILEDIGQQAIISPLHDSDINQGTNEVKKPHYHVLLLWDGPTTEKNAKGVISMIGGVGCFACMSVRGSTRYFCHLDNPDKYQYNIEDLRQLGGINLQDILLSDSDETNIIFEIFDYIEENYVDSYREFMKYCRENRPDWANLILHKHRENVFRYIRSMEYDIIRGKVVYTYDENGKKISENS